MMSDYLPEEVIVEILRRLPIKTILRCTCVCKLWYSLITNPNFISNHLQRPISCKNKLLLLSIEERYIKNSKLHYDDNDFRECMLLDPPFDGNGNLRIAGCCNGLICMYAYDYISGGRFVLWNPSIRKYHFLPSPLFNLSCPTFVGFGFDSKTRDYKVLWMFKNFRTELYSLKQNSWKNITHITPNFTEPACLSKSVFVNGALHWIGYRNGTNEKQRRVIRVFDLRDEIFHEIMLPQLVEDHEDLRVGAYEESSIAVFHRKCEKKTETVIWVMKEYGVVASWMMLGTVGKSWRGMSSVLGFRNNGDALLQFSRKLSIASQNIKSSRVKILLPTLHHRYCEIYSYEESLALLGKVTDARTAATSGPIYTKRMKISN